MLFAWYGLSCQEIPVTCAEEPYNCSQLLSRVTSAVIFLRTAAKELSFLGYAFSLEFEKNFWKKGTESHTPLCQTIFSGNTGHMMLPRTILRVISTNECKRTFFCFGLSTSHFMALGICIDFSSRDSGEYSIALVKVLVFKHATSTNNHTNFLWKIRNNVQWSITRL